jgi:UDP-N-acetylmuramoyl-tripeptide--D-alanyl-D-alanine ligase
LQLPLRIITDSREAGPATIFWALRGETHDGHSFVEAALAAGCDAAVVEPSIGQEASNLSPLPSGERVPAGRVRGPHNESAAPNFHSAPPHPAFGHLLAPRGEKGRTLLKVNDTLTALQNLAAWNRQRHSTRVVGITGSFGKTTTREMIHAALQYEVNSHRSPRNFNNHFGVPLTLLGLTAQHAAAIVELGASAYGEIRKLSEIASPEIGIITGIGQAHRASFGNASDVAAAKGELAEALPSDGLLLLCGDDAHSASLAQRASSRTTLVGTGPDCDVRAESIQQNGEWLSVKVDGVDFQVRAAGKHFARSVLFAVATAREFGLSDQQIAAGLADFQASTGRCSVEAIGDWTVIDDSYNASPEAVEAACGLLGSWPTEARRILVCGDMLELGDAAAACHQDAGLAAARAGVDRIFALGEFSQDLVGAAIEAGLDPNCGEAFHDLNFLLHRLQQTLRPGDVILVKGSRGMRMERVIAWLRGEVMSAMLPEHVSETQTIPGLG